MTNVLLVAGKWPNGEKPGKLGRRRRDGSSRFFLQTEDSAPRYGEHTGDVQVDLTTPPARGLLNFLERKRNQPLFEFVPDLCPSIADLGVLADLVRRKSSKLRGISGSRGTDSVPGHHILNNLVISRKTG